MATKILLVEDDNSLREIYGVRLQAEGYQIVSASDGEQALAVAIKERPALIITDVMMPKISGFDMLDILRSTSETKDIKVIMMTALSGDDQRSRGERMGADKYLVKSQVGIEDVVRTVHEVLGDAGSSTTAAPVAAATVDATQAAPSATPATDATATPPASTPDASASAPASSTPSAMASSQPATVAPSASTPTFAPYQPATSTDSTNPTPSSSKQRVIQPLNDPTAKVDINELLDKELAKEAGLDMLSRPQVASSDQEKAIIQDQLQTIDQTPPTQPQPAPTAEPPATPAAPQAETGQPVAPVAPPPSPASIEAAPQPSTPPQTLPPRPATPNVPGRDAPLRTPPRIPTI